MQLLRNSSRKTNCPSNLLLIKTSVYPKLKTTLDRYPCKSTYFLQIGFYFNLDLNLCPYSLNLLLDFPACLAHVGTYYLLWDDTIINCFECTLLNVSGLDNPLKYFPHKSRISIWNNCLCKEGYFNGFDIF